MNLLLKIIWKLLLLLFILSGNHIMVCGIIISLVVKTGFQVVLAGGKGNNCRHYQILL
jgi:hypothetical protein